MKNILLSTIFVVFLSSCKNDTTQRIVGESLGNINELTVVIENKLWEGNVGDQIRTIFAAPVDGLPQDEPLFTLKQIPPSVFDGFATKGRTILKIEEGSPEVKYLSNVLAKPQRLILITGNSNQELIDQLSSQANKMITLFKQQEQKEKLRRISLSPHNTKTIQEALGITLKFPSVYRIAKEEKDFFWIRKDITTGTTNLLIYQLPLSAITINDSLVPQMIKIRDSIGKAHIPGPLEGSYMITEKAYSPFLFETEIQGRKTYEIKSTWEVKNAVMGGPFINYLIEDKPNNRYLILEGFAFAPSVAKRDYMFELETIIKSVKIN
ncbi:MAG TPA: DUF4837 family protein [Flavobacteriaceae bacterium]|nr:DUF4837 family protein [Flavobacteriaceae bacterium]